MTGFDAQTPASWPPVVLLDKDNATSSRRLQDGSGGKGGGQREFDCLLPILVKPHGITFIPFYTS